MLTDPRRGIGQYKHSGSQRQRDEALAVTPLDGESKAMVLTLPVARNSVPGFAEVFSLTDPLRAGDFEWCPWLRERTHASIG
jgi:hypothetical protein